MHSAIVKNLQIIDILSNVTSIGNYVFDGSKIKYLNIGYSSDVLYLPSGLLYGSSIDILKINRKVTWDGNNSPFCNTKKIRWVMFGNEIDSIKNLAFYNCDSLSTVSFGKELKYIGEYAFYGCDSLTRIAIPSNVEAIEKDAFSNCQNLVSVLFDDSEKTLTCHNNSFGGSPISYIYLGRDITWDKDKKLSYGQYYSPFSHNKYLKQLSISSTVTKIEDDAFEDCDSLENIRVGAQYIGTGAFFRCQNLCRLYFYDSPRGNITIGEWAFANCGLKSIEFSKSVTSIGNNAFTNCTELPSVTIGNNITEIGEGAFSWCRALSSVSFGSGINKIGKEVFFGCGFTSLTIPQTIEQIDAGAFRQCGQLKSLTIEDSDKPLNFNSTNYNGQFSSCPVEELYLGRNVSWDSDFNSPFSDNQYLTTLTISKKVTTLNNEIFRLCNNISSLNIPNSVTSIGNMAFFYCNKMSSLTIPGSVNHIGDYAFYQCSGLQSITTNMATPSKLTYGDEIFTGVDKETCQLYVPSGAVEQYRATSPWSEFKIINGKQNSGDVNGDGAVNGADVTALYNYILNGDTTHVGSSDVNGDGAINGGDVTAVYNIILGI